jgi:hypothetical protein
MTNLKLVLFAKHKYIALCYKKTFTTLKAYIHLFEGHVEVEVNSRPTVCRPVCLGVGP